MLGSPLPSDGRSSVGPPKAAAKRTGRGRGFCTRLMKILITLHRMCKTEIDVAPAISQISFINRSISTLAFRLSISTTPRRGHHRHRQIPHQSPHPNPRSQHQTTTRQTPERGSRSPRPGPPHPNPRNHPRRNHRPLRRVTRRRPARKTLQKASDSK
jgi:hypothetical protein